jgi:hypothetical protein
MKIITVHNLTFSDFIKVDELVDSIHNSILEKFQHPMWCRGAKNHKKLHLLACHLH